MSHSAKKSGARNDSATKAEKLSLVDSLLPDFMNEEQRHNLLRVKQGGAKYHFKVINLSIAENYVLEPFWTWVTETFYPMWLAPNLITLIGFILMLLAHVFLWSCYPLALHESAVYAQWWYRVCCLCACVFLFLYQTLDGSDGKQARRTKQSSPLGEVFDHGVDAVCLTIHVCIIAVITLNTPDFSWYSWIHVVGMWFAFFTAHYEHMHTKFFYVGHVGVPDAQFLIVLAAMITAYTGHTFWTATFWQFITQLTSYMPSFMAASIVALVQQVTEVAPATIVEMTLGDVLLWSLIGGGIIGAVRCVFVVFQKAPSVHAVLDLVPVAVLSIIFAVYTTVTTSHIWHTHYFTTCLTFGLVFGVIQTTYNIARVSESEFFIINKQHVASVAPLMLLVLNSSSVVYGSLLGLDAPPINEIALLYALLVYESVFYLVFATSVIRSFCRALDIQAFSITRKASANKKTQ